MYFWLILLARTHVKMHLPRPFNLRLSRKLPFTVCPAFYVSLERARHSVKICGAWVAAMEVYENLCVLWPIMESMAALDSMALRTGFADAELNIILIFCRIMP